MIFTAIIPARFASTRFPGKPLVLIGKKPMIQHVYERVAAVLPRVYVATDDIRIADAVKLFGGNVVMTDTAHTTGTDRCAEAVAQIDQLTRVKTDVILNIQGDEPFIREEQIVKLMDCFNDPNTEIATLVRLFKPSDELFGTNNAKVVIDKNKFAIYFSRSVIPFVRNHDKDVWLEKHTFYKHLGVYAYKKNILEAITKLQPSALELAESLEQNRWIENGFRIKTDITEFENLAVDTPEDLLKIINSGLLK